MYCRDCQYPLKGLSAENCPECGREFDPDDPHTFSLGRRWVTRVAIIIGAAAVLPVLLGWGVSILVYVDLFFHPASESYHVLPAAAFVALLGGIPLLLDVVVFWKRLPTLVRLAFAFGAFLGVALVALFSLPAHWILP